MPVNQRTVKPAAPVYVNYLQTHADMKSLKFHILLQKTHQVRTKEFLYLLAGSLDYGLIFFLPFKNKNPSQKSTCETCIC